MLFAAILVSLFLNLFRFGQVPPCLNADEAAFAYNAYSIAKTGKDEFGRFLPLRFESFQDYKLPLFVYASVPFVELLGLNELSTRLPNVVISLFFVPLVYLITKKLFRNQTVALLTAWLAALTPWTYILSRHAHEGVIGAVFMLVAVYYLIDLHRSISVKSLIISNACVVLAANSYHSYRMFVFFWVGWEILLLLTKTAKTNFKLRWFWLVVVLTLAIPIAIDASSSLNRVSNLFFTQNPGIHLRLQEYLTEHNLPILHNIYTQGIRDVTDRYFEQISPGFFLIWGDKNWRFGYQYLGLITPVEYLFIFVGLYYLFKEKHPQRYLLLLLLAASPIPNALTWQDASLIRVYFMIFPLLIIVGFGLYRFLLTVKRPLRPVVFVALALIYGFYLINSWDVYFFHYPKRIEVIRAWQCGYKELGDYVKQNYNKYDRFVITDRLGQPYIFLLYYLQYDPAKYQKQATMTIPDGYGFGQVEGFDKFSFKFRFDPQARKTVFVGYPEEFKGLRIDPAKIKKIQIRSEEIFWIYAVN